MFTSFAIDSNRLYIFESIFMAVCWFFFFYVSFLLNFGAMTLFITLNPLDLRARWCKQKSKQTKKNQNKCFQRTWIGWRFHFNFYFNFNRHEMPYYVPSRWNFTLKPIKHAPFSIKEPSYDRNKLITNINYRAKRKYTFGSGATW